MEKIWEKLSREQIDGMLNETIEKIFLQCDLTSMTKYEKRKRIYEYLVSTKKYNYEYFMDILKNHSENHTEEIFPRYPKEEFLEPLISDKGICNGFSQIYKLLLEKVGIYSFCINCMIKHDNQFFGHQLNLVYDEETTGFSFDDITFGIIKQTIDGYFDYDSPEKTEEMQGYAPLYDDIKWLIADDFTTNEYAKREKNIIEKPNGIRIDDRALRELSDLESKGIKLKSRKKIVERRGIK